MLSGKYPLFIALFLGLVAGVLAYSAIKAQQKKVRAGWDTVSIVCAKVDIPEGTELDKDMVEREDMPSRFVTESYIRADKGNGEMDVVGQRVMVPLKAHDPILVSHFESARDTEFSTMINPKGRAVTIDVTDKQAVGLWVRPNDHVDVVGTFKDAESNGLKTVTLLQNVLVLATGRINANTTYIPDEDKRFQNVTLLMLPEEAEILTLAQEAGSITLLLRNPEDLDYQDNRRVVDSKALLAKNNTDELMVKRNKAIQIIRGNKSSANEGTSATAAPKAGGQ
ncbi:MAG: Flp pilus assembly protein CpaB [Deltaproteobacteria bacterium]|nr:Flp pilus assembly protein CpaB [Deltaproteobacteria bacterium]